jgi:hypothetical protein
MIHRCKATGFAAAVVLLAGQAHAEQQQGPSHPTSAPAQATSESSDAAAVPPGAPDDDYGLVAWCEGALSGHMALFPLVKPELDRMEQTGDKAKDAEMDAEQLAAGREYLELYARARQAANRRGDGAPARAEQARRTGEDIWIPVRKAEPKDRMWSWVMWELPARCETAARRLEAGLSSSGEIVRRHSSDEISAPQRTPPVNSPGKR